MPRNIVPLIAAIALLGIAPLTAAGCKKSAPAPKTGTVTAAGVGTAAAGTGTAAAGTGSAAAAGSAAAPKDVLACKSDRDCAVSCVKSDRDCCAVACQCAVPYTKTELARVEAARKRACANKKVLCPQLRCTEPTHRVVPKCKAGRCTAAYVPK